MLKTYQTAEAQTYYETEQEGFKRLKDDGMPPSNIIGFYGGFVRQETYNIILEYADLGNLDDYMKQTPPPSTTEEKLTFWGNFLAVINGLVKIHGEGEDDPDIFQILLGYVICVLKAVQGLCVQLAPRREPVQHSCEAFGGGTL